MNIAQNQEILQRHDYFPQLNRLKPYVETCDTHFKCGLVISSYCTTIVCWWDFLLQRYRFFMNVKEHLPTNSPTDNRWHTPTPMFKKTSDELKRIHHLWRVSTTLNRDCQKNYPLRNSSPNLIFYYCHWLFHVYVFHMMYLCVSMSGILSIARHKLWITGDLTGHFC